LETFEKTKKGPKSNLFLNEFVSLVIFLQRQADSIVGISEICFTSEIPHIVNGAYFLQIKKAINLVNSSVSKRSRIDAVVCSTDKNFLTPVGGSIILTPSKNETSMATKV
jgi:O-phospho-L-seryl-tRNASec:L-selenocysteinyl-tRNA synthase